MTWRDVRPIAVAAVTRPRDSGEWAGSDDSRDVADAAHDTDDPHYVADDSHDVADFPVEVMLAEHYDPAADETFYRPVGGAVEFGEHSSEALVREFAEELGVSLSDFDLLATLERTFTFDGTDGHEIWFLYEATIADDWPYERDRFTAEEPELDETFDVVWKPLADFSGPDSDVVYPEELPDLL